VVYCRVWICLDAYFGNDMKPGFGLVEFACCLVIPLGVVVEYKKFNKKSKNKNKNCFRTYVARTVFLGPIQCVGIPIEVISQM